MFKMQIKMNEEKILREDVINLQKVYAFIDELVTGWHFDKEPTTDGSIIYAGSNEDEDFGNALGIVMGLMKQPWWLENVSEWYLLSNEESADKSIYEKQDFLTSPYLRV